MHKLLHKCNDNARKQSPLDTYNNNTVFMDRLCKVNAGLMRSNAEIVQEMHKSVYTKAAQNAQIQS